MNLLIIGIALTYMAGILLAEVGDIPSFYAWLGTTTFLLLAILFLGLRPSVSSERNGPNGAGPKRDILFFTSVLLTVFGLGILSYQFHSQTAANNIAHLIGTRRREAILRGVVIRDPERTVCPRGQMRTRLVVEVKRLRLNEKKSFLPVTAPKKGSLSRADEEGDSLPEGAWLKTSGRVKIHLRGVEVMEVGSENSDEGKGRLRYGDDLIFRAQVHQPRVPANPGEFDYRRFLQRQGICVLAWIDSRDMVRLGSGRLSPLLRWIYELRYRLERIIDQTVPAPERELLKAMLLGQRQGITREMQEEFVETGTVHILAISGLHVGLVALAILGILKLFRLPRKLRYGLALALLVIFAFLTGLRPPVVRATLMAGVVMGALLLDRKTNVYTSLSLAAILMLMVNPHFLFDIGFQLSFVAVLSIVCLCPKIEEEVFGRAKRWIRDQMTENSEFTDINQAKSLFFNIGLRAGGYLITLFSVSAAAGIGIMPLVWRNFQIIAPVALLANLFAVPLLFVSVISGLGLVLTGLIWVEGASLLWAGICRLALSSLIAGNSLFLQIPFGHFYLGPPPVYFLLSYYLLIGLAIRKTACNYSESREKSNLLENSDYLPVRPQRIFWYPAVLLALLNLAIWPAILKPSPNELRVTFLDVGHGKSTLIEFPGGGNMLIDAGRGEAGRWTVQPFLLNRGISRLNTLVLTHPDYDHWGGARILLDNLRVDRLFDNGAINMPERECRNPAYREWIITEDLQVAGLKTDLRLTGYSGAVKIEVLHPPWPWLSLDDNDNNSLVLKITYGEIDILLGADIQEEAMKRLLSLGDQLQAEILLVPHHGRRLGPAGRLFLEKVRPQIAIISVDEDNRFGFPDEHTVSLLEELGSLVLQTGISGAITSTTNGRDIEVQTFKNCQCQK